MLKPRPVETTALAEFSGLVAATPTVRTRVSGSNGHTIPVLCIEINTGGALAASIRIEQPFPETGHAACEAAARRFKPGQHVTVQAPLHSLRLYIGAAAHIHIDQEPAP